jgi:predicted  nucleic acid-binding Zn-ribbon protein
LEELKRLREENAALNQQVDFQQSDLSSQTQKFKDMQTKYESEVENLRSQLKGSQSEQFVRQQLENKKLIEHNALLIREVESLRYHLT